MRTLRTRTTCRNRHGRRRRWRCYHLTGGSSRRPSPPRGLSARGTCHNGQRGESCSERKRVARPESGNANLYYQDILHIAEFFQSFSGFSTVTKDRTRTASAVRRRTYGSMAPHRLRTLMPKRQTDRSDIWALRAVVQGTGHMPIGLLALSFCECLRSVKQSRRLNLSALSLMHLGVCHYSCGAST